MATWLAQSPLLRKVITWPQSPSARSTVTSIRRPQLWLPFSSLELEESSPFYSPSPEQRPRLQTLEEKSNSVAPTSNRLESTTRRTWSQPSRGLLQLRLSRSTTTSWSRRGALKSKRVTTFISTLIGLALSRARWLANAPSLSRTSQVSQVKPQTIVCEEANQPGSSKSFDESITLESSQTSGEDPGEKLTEKPNKIG